MRTTLQIDDDILRAAQSLARSEKRSTGAVISELARRGLAPRRTASRCGELPTFEVPEDAAPITLEMVRGALED
jgi:hypothetical protein